MALVEERRERYWCANYACSSKSICMRFIDDSNPLSLFEHGGEKYTDQHMNYLEPFKSGMGQLMIPNNTGKCENFYEKSNSERVESYLS